MDIRSHGGFLVKFKPIRGTKRPPLQAGDEGTTHSNGQLADAVAVELDSTTPLTRRALFDTALGSRHTLVVNVPLAGSRYPPKCLSGESLRDFWTSLSKYGLDVQIDTNGFALQVLEDLRQHVAHARDVLRHALGARARQRSSSTSVRRRSVGGGGRRRADVALAHAAR